MRRSSSCYAVATPHRSVMSLPSSLFMLRGGEQEEQDRVAEVDDESHNTNDSVEEELHYSDSKSWMTKIHQLLNLHPPP